MEKLLKYFSWKAIGESCNKGKNGGSTSFNGNESGKRADHGYAKSKTAGSTSGETKIVNNTNKTLIFRDKVGPAYGGTRYEIQGKSAMKVTTLQHTFFKMLLYVIEEETEEVSGTSESSTNSTGQSKTKKKRTVDTGLTIDSDQIADYQQIAISWDGSKYHLAMIPR